MGTEPHHGPAVRTDLAADVFKINSFYNSGNQLAAMQLVTWNDYEEGTEIESGIDNCVAVSAAMTGNSLQWKVTGNENTIDHYVVYISTDGQNLMSLNPWQWAHVRSISPRIRWPAGPTRRLCRQWANQLSSTT